MKFKNIDMANILFTSWAINWCVKILFMEIFDEKFDGIFDFVGFYTKFSFFFWAVHSVSVQINLRKLCF